MANPRRKQRRTDDQYIEGVKRIDAPPEDIARALFRAISTGKPKSPTKQSDNCQ